MDIDKNGTDELLIGLTNGEKWELFEVYYMNGNTPLHYLIDLGYKP